MSNSIKEIFRHAIRKLGWDVHRYQVSKSDDARLQAILSSLEIDLIIDVGANIGQYAKGLRNIGYFGNIVSFEPMSAAHMQLVEAGRTDKRWAIAPRMALGRDSGDVAIHISGNSVSSSLLNMTDIHISAQPTSAPIATEMVPVRTLDSVFGEYGASAQRVFLKVDVQGYELEVLNGALQSLDHIVALQIEVSLCVLYLGQPSMDEIIAFMKANRFEVMACMSGFSDETTGRAYQIDLIFVRADKFARQLE